MKYIFLFYMLILVLIAGCANPLPPTGGPPDKTPPKILQTEPLNGTLNFHDKAVYIEFSKYMDKYKVIDNVFITPSKQMNFSWSGKELEIKFAEPLDSNTTYAITFGTEYVDLHGNKPTDAFILIFSTGNKIDSGSIYGKLYDDTPSGVFVFAYALDSIKADTLNPFLTKPLARTQVGTSGKFEFHALKPGKYRLMAVRDKFKDGILDKIIDDFGAANDDTEAKHPKDTSSIIKMRVGAQLDKSPIAISSIEAKNNRIIQIGFNKAVDTVSLNKNCFKIQDSAGTKTIDVNSAYIIAKNSKTIEIISAFKLDTNIKWKAVMRTDSLALRDTIGNKPNDTANFAYFYSVKDKDSTKPVLEKLPFRDSTSSIEPEQDFNFVFNIGMHFDSLDIRIKIIKGTDKEEIPVKVSAKGENILRAKPDKELLSDVWYMISIRTDNLFAENGLKISDSTYKIRFKTKDIRNYGGIKGSIKNFNTSAGKCYVTIVSKDKRFRMESAAKTDGSWDFPKVPAGIYTFEAYYDRDGSGKFYYGEPFPYKFSEAFTVLEKEYEIKPRWTIENVVLDFNN